jgi:polyisoprenoid-binding protein YceI
MIRSLLTRFVPLWVGFCLFFAAGLAVAQADLRRWDLDPTHFSVAFLVDHARYARVIGMFLRAEGHLLFDPDTRTLGAGEFIIHTDSVFTNHEGRDQHLRGRDFLHVERYPTMIFRSRSVEWSDAAAGTGRLHGDLELLGVTRPVTLDLQLNQVARYPFPLGGVFSRPYVLGASLRGTIRRSEWGMRYGLLMDLVGDEIELLLEFEAQRQ